MDWTKTDPGEVAELVEAARTGDPDLAELAEIAGVTTAFAALCRLPAPQLAQAIVAKLPDKALLALCRCEDNARYAGVMRAKLSLIDARCAATGNDAEYALLLVLYDLSGSELIWPADRSRSEWVGPKFQVRSRLRSLDPESIRAAAQCCSGQLSRELNAQACAIASWQRKMQRHYRRFQTEFAGPVSVWSVEVTYDHISIVPGARAQAVEDPTRGSCFALADWHKADVHWRDPHRLRIKYLPITGAQRHTAVRAGEIHHNAYGPTLRVTDPTPTDTAIVVSSNTVDCPHRRRSFKHCYCAPPKLAVDSCVVGRLAIVRKGQQVSVTGGRTYQFDGTKMVLIKEQR